MLRRMALRDAGIISPLAGALIGGGVVPMKRYIARPRAGRGLFVALLALALAGCAPPWGQRTSTATPSPTGAPTVDCASPSATLAATATSATPPAQASPQQNAAVVLQTPRPSRDLYSLTQHLVEHSAQPIPPRVRSTPRNEQVGQVTTFWVVNPTQTGYHQIQATLVAVTPHVYMYLQNDASADTSALRAEAENFERQTYPRDRAFFGEEWSPGPDADVHITVLNATNLGPIGGYFSSEDEYPRAVSPYSNERQMIYVNLDGGEIPGRPGYASTLAHEFQHMIHWHWHPSDPSWVNEGSSVLAEHINGYSAGGVDQVFLAHPETMLGGWVDDQGADIAHYGAGYLFMDYFTEHYGGNAVLRELLTDPNQTPLNFERVLAAHKYSDRFNDVFAKFVLATLLNDTSLAGGAYGYPSIPGQRAQPQHVISSYPYADGSQSTPARMPQYAAQYYDFRPADGGAGTLRLSFQGEPTVGIVENTPYGGAPAEWWSNTSNNLDSTLTHAFDLSGLSGRQVSLCFQAWYSLEPDFDYAYVEVSTDGGQNWTPLPVTSSASTNPNGMNYGHGITGISGGAASDSHCGPTPQWVPAGVDLSPYAGKSISLRFESITDDAVHCPGLALDAVRIPQLGFRDDVATDNGWQAQGWIRSTNVLPEQYAIQAVVYHAGQTAPQIVRIPVSAAGAATYTFNGFGSQITRVVVATSALAPATIVPARYTLNAQVG
jgi:hypothetical protein